MPSYLLYFQPSCSRVRWLEAGLSAATKGARRAQGLMRTTDPCGEVLSFET